MQAAEFCRSHKLLILLSKFFYLRNHFLYVIFRNWRLLLLSYLINTIATHTLHSICILHKCALFEHTSHKRVSEHLSNKKITR